MGKAILDGSELIYKLIETSKGEFHANEYKKFKITDFDDVTNTAREILGCVPHSHGACALMSSTWAGILNDNYSIPAIVVAGDLEVKKVKVFRCTENLPDSKNNGEIITRKWDGHCWIEIDGVIGDLSIFRTAYSASNKSLLKNYLLSTYGRGRGALICHNDALPNDLKYIPKYVLNDNQIKGLIAGMAYSMKL